MPSTHDGDPGADSTFTLANLGRNLVLTDTLHEHLCNTQVSWGELWMKRFFGFESCVENKQLCLNILEFRIAQLPGDFQVE
ncbi:hypothetical protein A4H96_10745 [Acidithiobacillus ferrooxidans]|uniref:Uncharacterized protein n=1 Tax=Acidithiobacillus ferrooxidans TaxID=920 RepID=A0A179BCC8_ACIFR|nr:hypothetical protein A4H96_10745 [Acidithiobacillus ferrooxidans]